jgi:hypothetical protein
MDDRAQCIFPEGPPSASVLDEAAKSLDHAANECQEFGA